MEAVLKGAEEIMANTQRRAPVMTPEMTDGMRDYRLYQLGQENPIKSRSSFQSDEEYRNYLLDTYVRLRQTEYEYTVRNETMKVYNLAADAQKKVTITIGGKPSTHYDNQLVWDGYQKYINSAKTPEERARREQQVADCAMGRATTVGGICMSGQAGAVKPAEGLHCCAVTASCVVAQISGEMGYDGDDNLIVPKSRVVNGAVGRRNNIVAASYINQADSIQEHIRINPEIRYEAQKPKTKTLCDAIKSGDLKVGDSFALGPKNPNAETTGHAMVVADIIRDQNGNITAYTIQGNNPHQLLTLGINDRTGRGGSTVIAGVGTNAFMEGNFVAERQELSHLSTQELEARVVTQRSNTEQVITNFAATERFFAENKLYNDNAAGFVNNYVQQYNAAMGNQAYRIHQTIMEIDDDVPEIHPLEETVRATATPRVNPAEIEVVAPVNPARAQMDGAPRGEQADVVEPVVAQADVEVPVVEPVVAQADVEAPVVEPVMAQADVEAPVVEPVMAQADVEAPVVEPAVAQAEVAEPVVEPQVAQAAPATRNVAEQLFMGLDEAGWQQLVQAYLGNVNKDMPVADVMRENALMSSSFMANGNAPSLVEDLAAVTTSELSGVDETLVAGVDGQEPVADAAGAVVTPTDENVIDEAGRRSLADNMSGDKTEADGLFGSLLTALTTNDNKDLDESMKFALNLLTSFLGGEDMAASDDVPSLSDFMKYLTKDNDNMLAQSLEDKPRVTTMPSILMKTTFNTGRC